MPSPVTAFVPLKALDEAKSRLAPALSSAQRRDLALRMAGAVCDACIASPAIASVVLLAGDAAAATVAEGRDVTVRRSPAPGLAAALDDADAAVGDARASLVVAADLPQVHAAELTALVAAAGHGPAVIVAPTVDGGTGALLRQPPSVMATAFGWRSATAHQKAAEHAGVRVVRWWSPALGHDVDEPDDLASQRCVEGTGR